MSAKKQALEADIEFISVFKMKENWNEIGLPFKGLGEGKLLKLIGAGIATSKELMDHNGGDPAALPQWRQLTENCHDNLEVNVGVLTECLSLLNDSLVWNSIERDLEVDEMGDSGSGMVEGVEKVVNKTPPFSPLVDVERCNGGVVSKSVIDRIVATDFQHRKPSQHDKMRGHKADALKIDWHCKLPGKA